MELLELKPGEIYAERYRIARQIGRGGMGRVYLAEDLRLNGKARALKLTMPQPEERRIFLPEAQLLCGLEHRHLPAIVDYYPPDEHGVACIVMAYIGGPSLLEMFERARRKLPFAVVLRYVVQLCDVLVYLHDQQPAIVFRDLKPSNVIIDRHDNAVLVDFGIARQFRAGAPADTMQLGTPGFAAPEQLGGEQSDTRTDLYGLGALAYYLLSEGRFAGSHSGSMRKALQPDVPPAFAAILERLLSCAPSHRPASARLLREELAVLPPAMAEPALALPMRNGRSAAPNARTGDVTIVAIASAYTGAGATFASLALSAALSRAGIAHALVEGPGGRAPELYALLDGARRMPKGAVFAESEGRAAEPAWRSGNAAYYPLHPQGTSAFIPDDSFSHWLRRLGVPVVLLDMSSGWDSRPCREWLIATAEKIWMVADCFPAKWCSARQEACLALQHEARQHKRELEWIANRDQPFPHRKTWLSLFPSRPAALLPNVSGEALLTAIWEGRVLPDDARIIGNLDRSLQKLIDAVIRH